MRAPITDSYGCSGPYPVKRRGKANVQLTKEETVGYVYEKKFRRLMDT